MVQAPPGSQEVLVGADPNRFFVPPYLGPKGWVGMRLDDDPASGPDWDEVRFIVRRSYSLIAPKKLAALLEPDSKTAGRDGGDV
ncbi:MmcQ/YjbR family DNA-binding protein [Fodinicurvata sp. EGI_FJ10296]|uniref:MmcQ/YjbR family DNA-binding protein n=1 Tax=Fodinicurvata sp. EGI_FJ10296 TaxID=3231908 RepID=UPI00345422DC